MANYTFELWDKYWSVKDSPVVATAIATLLAEEGVVFAGQVKGQRLFLPERLVVTINNVSKTPTVDHRKVAERLGELV